MLQKKWPGLWARRSLRGYTWMQMRLHLSARSGLDNCWKRTAFTLSMAGLSVDRHGHQMGPGFICQVKMPMKSHPAFRMDRWKPKASAMKMCYAAYTKGTTALLAMILAAAESLGVRDELYQQWDMDEQGFSEQVNQRAARVTAKAWRF